MSDKEHVSFCWSSETTRRTTAASTGLARSRSGRPRRIEAQVTYRDGAHLERKGFVAMRRSGRSSNIRLCGLVASVALCIGAVSCSDDEESGSNSTANTVGVSAPTATVGTPSDACADRDALRESVAALGEIDVIADGTNGVKGALEAVSEDLDQVQASAGSAVRAQVDAVRSAIDALQAGLQDLGDGGARQVAQAITALSTAANGLVAALDGGPCG